MRTAIIGNPTTSISSGKFLDKFVKVAKSFSSHVIILNDGYPETCIRGVYVHTATRWVKTIETQRSSTFASVIKFCIAQLCFCIAVLRYLKNVSVVFVFPITMSLPVILSKMLGKKLVLYGAQDIWSEGLRKGLVAQIRFCLMLQARSLVLKCIDHIVVEGASSITANKIEEYMYMISVVPLFVDTDRYKVRVPITQRGNVVSFIGFLDYRKGALEFAKAIIQLTESRKDITFKIIGDGPLYNEIATMLAGQIHEKLVTMSHKLSEPDFLRMLNETKLCVLPSKAEGLPGIILESMASGTLTLATPVGAIPDVVRDGETGFLMKSGSSEAIVKSILRALESPNAQRVSSNALELIQREFSYTNAVARYGELLKQL